MDCSVEYTECGVKAESCFKNMRPVTLARGFKGYHEVSYECGTDLQKRLIDCPKYSNHSCYTPLQKFTLDKLPKGYRDPDIYKFVKVQAELTVRVVSTITSASRPDGYAFHEFKGQGRPRYGTGFIQHKMKIRSVKVGSHRCRHQLVLATTDHLISWDLLSLSVLWCIQVQASILIRDPASDLMAFVSEDKLHIFQPSSCEMLFQQDRVSSSEVLAAVFVPGERDPALADVGWPGKSQIYLYNADQQLITLDSPQYREQSSKRVKIAQNIPQSTLSSFLAESVVKESPEIKTKDTMGKTTAVQDNFFTSLLQSNEPVSLYCDKYLNSLLVKRKKKRRSASHTDDESESDQDAKESSSSESEDEASKPPAKYARIAPGAQTVRNSKHENMDKLLAKPLDWVQWCSSLSLK